MAIFNTQKEKSTENNAPANRQNIIGYGTTIIGNMSCAGPVRIDGKVEGDIESNNKVIIGRNGEVKGEIKGKEVDVAGTFEGKIFSEEALHIKSTAKLNGEVTSKSLSIEEGAVFNAVSKITKETLQVLQNNSKSKASKSAG